MTIDNTTSIKIVNRYANVTGIYTLYYFTENIGSDQTASLNALLRTGVTANTTIGTALRRIGEVFKNTLTGKYTYTFVSPGDAIGTICVYLAACCFMRKTAACKPLIDAVIDTYRITIENSTDLVVTKDILKELTGIMLDRYEAEFAQIVKDLGIENELGLE